MAGRPKGVKNFNPNKRRLEDAFREKGFNYVDEFVKNYNEATPQLKIDLLKHLTEFLFPKRRAEDSDGTAGDSGPAVALTQVELLALVTAARNK